MDRIVAQQGTFTVVLDVLADHGALIDDIFAPTLQGNHSGTVFSAESLPIVPG